MGKDLKYGPGHIDDYPGANETPRYTWDKVSRTLLGSSGKAYIHPKVGSSKEEPLPKAYSLDLRHLYLLKRALAENNNQIKRWFLTAFIPKSERELIAIPKDLSDETIHLIKAQIQGINQFLEAPAEAPHDLAALKLKLETLFNEEHWLAVALQMVDKDKTLNIDTLNSLQQWQAAFEQFPGNKILFKTTLTGSLHSQHGPYNVASITDKKLHDVIFSEIRVKHNENFYALNNCQFRRFENSDTLQAPDAIYQMPSAKLREHFLRARNSLIMPLYIFGYLHFEYFVAAAFFNARPMHHYLRGGSNRYFAHAVYYGPALLIEHDDVHTGEYAFEEEYADKITENDMGKIMQMLAIVANVLVRFGEDSLANLIMDDICQMRSVYQTLKGDNTKSVKLVIGIYQEIIQMLGLTATKIECQIAPSLVGITPYAIDIYIQDKKYTFNGKLDRFPQPIIYPDSTELILYRHFEAIEKIALENGAANTVAPLLNQINPLPTKPVVTPSAPSSSVSSFCTFV